MKEQEKEPQNLMELLAQIKAAHTPKERYKLYVDRYLEKQARENGIPFNGQFELTPYCNLDCKMCYVHMQREQLKGQNVLTTQQWKQLMEQAADAGMRRAVITGGECLTYEGFDELYLYLQARGIEIQVYTNGILLTDERIRFFQKNMPAGIQISVYGSDEDGYERVAGCRVYYKVMRNIEHARQAGLPIRIAVTPSASMGTDAERLIRKLKERKLPYQINNAIYEPRTETGRDGEAHEISEEEYIRLFRLDAKLAGAVLVRTGEEDLPEIPEEMGVTKGIRCAAGRSSFHINWKGQMSACDVLEGSRPEPLQEGFTASWKQIHKEATEYPSPVKCGQCAYRDVCRSCPAQHRQSGAEPGACSQAVCNRTRRYAAEGLVRL